MFERALETIQFIPVPDPRLTVVVALLILAAVWLGARIARPRG